MQHPDPHPDPLGSPTTVLPDSLLPGAWSGPPAGPADPVWPVRSWPDQPAGAPSTAGFPEERAGRHQAPISGPGGVPLSFTDQLLEQVVGWWQGLRRAAVSRDRRLLIGAVVLLPTLAVFGVVALLPGPPSAPTAAVAPAPSTSPAADPSAAAAPAATVGQLTALTADRAAALMGSAGLSMPGAPDQVWTFTDSNGLNLLVATIEPTGIQDVTLRVALFGGVDGTPTALTRLADSGLPGCLPAGNPDNGKRKNEKRKKRDRSGQGNGGNQDQQAPPAAELTPEPSPVAAAGFTIDSVTLADHDGDGLGEVTIGWSSSCGDPATTSSRVELATLTGTRSFLLQGQGVIGGGEVTAEPAAQPTSASWPTGSFEAAQALFRTLYF